MSVFIGGPLDGQVADSIDDAEVASVEFYRPVEIHGAIHYAHESISRDIEWKEMELCTKT